MPTYPHDASIVVDQVSKDFKLRHHRTMKQMTVAMVRRQQPQQAIRMSRVAAAALLALLASGLAIGAPAAASPAPPPAPPGASDLALRGWWWPLTAFRVENAYAAPADRYSAGHRGIDLRPLDDGAVRAPADGTVAFSGAVADRGILTIDHGDGLVTTFEPILSSLEPGVQVLRGEAVGLVSLGGHTAAGSLHFGVRLDGEYINPLVLLGGVPRAVLLPCC